MPRSTTVSSFNQRFFETVGPHFVTLSCVQLTPEKKALVFSGFLVEAADAWFYVTAGHILRKIRAAINAGGEFDIWRLDDQTAGHQAPAIPYDFDISEWLVVENEENGLDYAAIQLKSIYCMQLKAGGAVAINKAGWGDHVSEHDQWAIVGFPSETVVYDDKSIITGRVAVMPLEHAEEPSVAGSKAENQFYACLKDMGNIKDIDGMSGGPIFALFKVNGEWRYKVIGIQSGWYPQTRTIAACPFATFGAELERLAKQA
ncbi:MAG: hypothetical protein ABL891_11820 [Burkholderiales bacterium]